jgi:sugar lactone lactonase YvrE
MLPSCGGGGNNGVTTQAKEPVGFNWPYDVAMDGTYLYVADTDNNRIRKIAIDTGEITTLAGNTCVQGSSNGVGAAAKFYWPEGMATDGTNLYVTDSQNNTVRNIVIATGAVTTLAGTPGKQGSSDGIGAEASFNWPIGITCDGTNLYVVDARNYVIRKIVIATGAVTTLAGTPGQQGTSDGVGNSARFKWPGYLTIVGSDLYVADSGIRKIEIATGTVTTLAGTASQFHLATGITTDGANLYVTDSGVSGTIKKVVIATGAVTTLVGTESNLYWPNGLTINNSYLYVADSGNNEIRKVAIDTGAVTTLAGSKGI